MEIAVLGSGLEIEAGLGSDLDHRFDIEEKLNRLDPDLSDVGVDGLATILFTTGPEVGKFKEFCLRGFCTRDPDIGRDTSAVAIPAVLKEELDAVVVVEVVIKLLVAGRGSDCKLTRSVNP